MVMRSFSIQSSTFPVMNTDLGVVCVWNKMQCSDDRHDFRPYSTLHGQFCRAHSNHLPSTCWFSAGSSRGVITTGKSPRVEAWTRLRNTQSSLQINRNSHKSNPQPCINNKVKPQCTGIHYSNPDTTFTGRSCKIKSFDFGPASKSGIRGHCMSALTHLKLSNGVLIPRVGLGTFRSRGENVQNAVKWAIETGIRHIDTASIYKNEEDISKALATVDVPRDELFITSKLSPHEQGRDKATAACHGILKRLATEYVDLMLVHWPGAAGRDLQSSENRQLRLESWKVLEEFYQMGRFRAIGVSNFEAQHLSELLEDASVVPMVNQFEVHPRFPNKELCSICKAKGITVVAYSSLGVGDLLSNAVVKEVAQKSSKSPAQVLLKWGLQKELAVIPKSVHREYIQEFSPAKLLDWSLDEDDVNQLDAINDNHRYCWDPSRVL